MSAKLVGPVPWLPAFLGAPIPAERLAAFRIGVGVMLLIDLIGTYLPFAPRLLGPGSFATEPGTLGPGKWSVVKLFPPEWGGYAVLLVTILSALSLTLGWRPRTSAFVAWVCVVSIFHANEYLHNGGDRLRSMFLLTLIFCPSGAVWAIGAERGAGPRLVSGWPARLVLVQLCCVYTFSALHKIMNPTWQEGTALLSFARNVQWSCLPTWLASVPEVMFRIGTWSALSWELLFPALIVLPRLRLLMLGLGVVFHLLTGVLFEVGLFPLYSICGYLPLLPWEVWCQRCTNRAE